MLPSNRFLLRITAAAILTLAPAATAWSAAPRTPDGQPDLQGMYTRNGVVGLEANAPDNPIDPGGKNPLSVSNRGDGLGPYPKIFGEGGAVLRGTSGAFFNCCKTSAIAASSCTSSPELTARGSKGTSMSGATPSFSTCHSPSGVKTRKNGTVRNPPSISAGLADIPINPPHVRVPISLPKLSLLKP